MREGSWREVRLDVASAGDIRSCIGGLRPGLVFYCSYDKALREITVDGARTAAAATSAVGGKFVLLSTDLVFDGGAGNYNEDMAATPTMPYGQLKVEEEVAVRNAAAGSLNLRPSLMWGESGWTRRPAYECGALENGEPVDAYADEWRTPVCVDDVARAAWELGCLDVSDIYHIGGPERLSRHQIARRLCTIYGFDTSLVREARRPEDRPRDTSLDSSRLVGLLEWKPQPMAAPSLSNV